MWGSNESINIRTSGGRCRMLMRSNLAAEVLAGASIVAELRGYTCACQACGGCDWPTEFYDRIVRSRGYNIPADQTHSQEERAARVAIATSTNRALARRKVPLLLIYVLRANCKLGSS